MKISIRLVSCKCIRYSGEGTVNLHTQYPSIPLYPKKNRKKKLAVQGRQQGTNAPLGSRQETHSMDHKCSRGTN